MDGAGTVSAPAADRAAELTAMLLDPAVRAVVPPWGGELAIDLLPLLDFAALAAAEPTWLVGYSDVSTVLLPLTLLTGIATLHSPNLMDTPYRVPEPLVHWLDAARTPAGGTIPQGSASHRQEKWADFRADPEVREMALTVPTRWQALGAARRCGSPAASSAAAWRRWRCCRARRTATSTRSPTGRRRTGWSSTSRWPRRTPPGRRGCCTTSGTPAGSTARPACWSAGRPAARHHGFSQLDALHHALDGLPVPVLYDVDIGHVPPQLALVNGASPSSSCDATGQGTLVQTLD